MSAAIWYVVAGCPAVGVPEIVQSLASDKPSGNAGETLQLCAAPGIDGVTGDIATFCVTSSGFEG